MPQIPPRLASLEACSLAGARLAPGDVHLANVGGFGFDDPGVAAAGETLGAAFPTVEGALLPSRRVSSRRGE